MAFHEEISIKNGSSQQYDDFFKYLSDLKMESITDWIFQERLYPGRKCEFKLIWIITYDFIVDFCGTLKCYLYKYGKMQSYSDSSHC